MTADISFYSLSMVPISNINTLKKICYAYLHSITKYGIVFAVSLPTTGRFSLYKRKLSLLWLVQNPEPLA